MKKITLLIGFLLVLLTNSVNAEYKIYTNVEDFEKDKGSICEAATDGCNNYFVKDGKIAGGTRMYCENHIPEWTCTKYKENTITTMSIDFTTTSLEEPMFCTMEYAPVCGTDGKTYSNSCMAGSIEIDYEGQCLVGLSQNDLNFYKSIKNIKLDEVNKSIAYKALNKYNGLISGKTDSKKIYYNTLMIKKIDRIISELLLKYPADSALPEKINNMYLMLTLLKFEIESQNNSLK